MKAAVLRTHHQPLSIEHIQIAGPGPRRVRTRTVPCGVCHSDLHALEGALPVPPPCVLGH
jgi:S-(hydroxymethyl)glutathione dehydrogenase/alcohol dehydrogenase